MSATRPLDWIQEVESSLACLEEQPQFGLPTSINWKVIESDLQKILQAKSIQLRHTTTGWVDAKQLMQGLGGELFSLAIDWSPINYSSYFVMEKQSLQALLDHQLGSKEASHFFYESGYVEGFYNYLAAEILRLLEKQGFATPLTPRLGPTTQDVSHLLRDEACFAIDVSLKVDSVQVWGRILLTESFRRAWKKYFVHLGPPALSDSMLEKLAVEVSLQIAYTRLAVKDWKNIKKGDFVLLDHCSYDPHTQRGAVVVVLHRKPILRGRLQGDKIKITHYPIYEEVSSVMEDELSGNKPFGEDHVYGDLGEDEEGEFDEEEEDLFGDLGLSSDMDSRNKEHERYHSSANLSNGTPILPEEFPIHMTVEVGRIRMTAGALMKLSPGSLLELNVSPEQGVDLVVNGKKVGKGELVRIGDILGVRILSL